jgi:hypothetical protein
MGHGLPLTRAAQDLENTTGSWDMYGQDDPKRYPALQETFFKQAADAVSRREALNGFVALCEWTCHVLVLVMHRWSVLNVNT